MKDILNLALNYKIEVACLIIFIIFVILFYRLRTKKIVQELIVESINEIEEYFNSETGQNKILLVEECLNSKIIKLPFFIRIFVKYFFTKYWIVTTIEKLLNIIQDQFDKGAKDIDIIGNEVVKKKE